MHAGLNFDVVLDVRPSLRSPLAPFPFVSVASGGTLNQICLLGPCRELRTLVGRASVFDLQDTGRPMDFLSSHNS